MLLTSAVAYADGWASYSSPDRIALVQDDAPEATYATACQAARSQAYSYLASHSVDYPYALAQSTGRTSLNHDPYCAIYLVEWVGSGQPDVASAPSGSVVYNAAYSDEQCQEQYGGYGRVNYSQGVNSSGGGSANTGACSVSLADDDDLECFDRPGSPTGGFCYGNRVATSTGEENDPSSSDASGGTDGDSGDDLPDYLTPAPDCQVNCVTFDGTTYKVDQSAIDDGYVNSPDLDNSGGGSNDGGSSGGSSGGDSGSNDGSDGGSSGGGSDGGDSGGSGGGGSGGSGGGSGGSDGGSGDTGDDDGLGLGDVIDAINDGFNGLVDKIAGVTDTVDGVKDAVDEGNQAAEDRFNAIADSAPTEADLDAQFGSADEHQGLMEEALNGAGETLTDYIDGTDSTFSNLVEGMKDLARSALPEIPSPSCQPLVFAPGKVYSITIDCEIFELIRSALAWILYVLTAWIMLSTMFASRPH